MPLPEPKFSFSLPRHHVTFPLPPFQALYQLKTHSKSSTLEWLTTKFPCNFYDQSDPVRRCWFLLPVLVFAVRVCRRTPVDIQRLSKVFNWLRFAFNLKNKGTLPRRMPYCIAVTCFSWPTWPTLQIHFVLQPNTNKLQLLVSANSYSNPKKRATLTLTKTLKDKSRVEQS